MRVVVVVQLPLAVATWMVFDPTERVTASDCDPDVVVSPLTVMVLSAPDRVGVSLIDDCEWGRVSE